MRPRRLTAYLCLIGFCIPMGVLKAQFAWVGSGANGLVGDILNWGGIAPTGSGTENLTFGISLGQTGVQVPTMAFNNVTFATGRQTYTFSGTGGTPVLTLNGNLTAVAGNPVTFDNSLGIQLAAGFGHVVDIAAATTVQVDGVISGGGHLSKNGTGTLVLTGANTFNYSGGLGFVNSTVVHAGTIHVNGGAINHGTGGDLFVGENNGDNGTLLVSNGGDINGYFGVLGQSNGSTGTATVTGIGSTWTTSSGMGIGYGGNGNLSILAGGTVVTPAHANNSDSYIGYGAASNSSALVSGTGSSWTTAAGLIIGYAGSGSLTISSEGAVSSAVGKIGEASGGSGSVTIQGNASDWTVTGPDLYVGNGGTGTLYLYNQGTINVGAGTGTIHLGHSVGGIGVLNIGTDGEGYFAGGRVDASFITTGSGTSGTVRLATNATSASPYYLLNGSSSPVIITGPTQVQQIAGYNVLYASSNYTGGTTITGGTLEVANSNALGTGSVTVSGTGTLLVDEYFINSSVTVNSGGRLGGIYGGYFNASINSGGRLAPGLAATGSNAIGTLDFEDLTLGQNGIFEVNVAFNGSSILYDQAYVQNSSTLTINATPANRFTLKVISLTSGYALGDLGGIVAGNTYSWLIFDTNGIYDITSNSSSITPASFLVDASAFSTAIGTGSFSVSQTGTNIYLNFTPVPEPSTYALMAAGLSLFALKLSHRGRKSRSAKG